MRIAILSRGDGWHVQDLIRAATACGHTADAVDFRTVTASIDVTMPGYSRIVQVPGGGIRATAKNCGISCFASHPLTKTGRLEIRQAGRSRRVEPLDCYDAILVRTMPAGSLEQIVFRMDVLHTVNVPVLNPPRAVETCVDKFLASARLAAAGIPTPETIACQTADDALAAFAELGGDVVVKPLFGAEGRGIVRVTDEDLAWRAFHAIEQTRGIIYIQKFVRHPGWDVRAFVLNGKVLAAMKRTNPGDWRSNVARGGTAQRYELARPEAELAVNAATATGATVAGVDLLTDEEGNWQVIEVNAVPGWRALAPTCDIDVADRVVRFLTEEYRP